MCCIVPSFKPFTIQYYMVVSLCQLLVLHFPVHIYILLVSARHCGVAVDVAGRSVDVSSEHYQGVATYQCLAGHVIEQNISYMNSVHCNTSGEWQDMHLVQQCISMFHI